MDQLPAAYQAERDRFRAEAWLFIRAMRANTLSNRDAAIASRNAIDEALALLKLNFDGGADDS